ncbi:MAG: hypothetical protein ACREP7_13860 [Lysobacter sp.]
METAEIPAEFDFVQVTRAVMGEEAWGYLFKGNQIKTRGGRGYNEASFEFRDAGYPADCVVLPNSQTPPAGYTVEWRGQMLVANRVRNVALARRGS